MLIISGAFGLFRKDDVVIAAGGYRRQHHRRGHGTGGAHAPHAARSSGSPTASSSCPTRSAGPKRRKTSRTLGNQRIRWQRGLSESLSANWRLMFSRRGGVPGWLAFPFMVLFEWLGPLVELGGYLFMAFAFAIGAISWQAFAVFLFVAVGLGILLSASGLLLEEMSFHIYPRLGQLAVLGLVVVAENFGYRQLNSWWRLMGLYRWARNTESSWGTMTRSAAWQSK